MDELVELLVADYLDDVDVSLSTMIYRRDRIEHLTMTLPLPELAEAETRAETIISSATQYASGVEV